MHSMSGHCLRPGYVVECVDNADTSPKLKAGKLYVIIDVREGLVSVSPGNKYTFYRQDRFKLKAKYD
jgi:hypothetical protein